VVQRPIHVGSGGGSDAVDPSLESPHALATALTRPENALVFGSYAAIALLVGTVLLYRRDTN
jgi:ABC-2 type transport system permease protein